MRQENVQEAGTMSANQKTIYVYDDFSQEEPILLGMLYVNVIKGGETYSFEYSNGWLKQMKLSVSLDPELMPYGGRQFPNGKRMDFFSGRKVWPDPRSDGRNAPCIQCVL